MATQDATRPVFIPVVLGTARQGRLSEPAANFVFGEVSKRGDIQTELIDIRKIPLAVDDAGEALKDSQFSAMVARADGLILVVPEYNHSFPGLLKHVLDTNLKEYIHKAVGVCGVSAGPFGGARMIQSLVPVLRELGLVTIFSDVYFGTAGRLFDPASGKITDPAYAGRVDKFLNELVWMARALRYARENIPAADDSTPRARRGSTRSRQTRCSKISSSATTPTRSRPRADSLIDPRNIDARPIS